MNMTAANSGWGLRGWRAHNFGLRQGAISDAARRELLIRGTAGSATILEVRPLRGEPGHAFWIRAQVDGMPPYETRVRQRVSETDLEWMRPGSVVCCRVDPCDENRLVLYVPDFLESGRASVAKILADGRRGDGTVLAAAPVAADYTGVEDPVLRLDLEMSAWDEPKPWRARLIQPVPLTALGLVDLGRHLEVAFFTVDHGESVAVDWIASLGDE